MEELLEGFLQGKSINTDMIITMIISLYGITIIMFLFKSIPMQIVKIISRLFTTRVLISSMDECYFSLIKLFQENNIVHRARSLRLINGKYGTQDAIDKSIGSGTHYFFYKNIPIKVDYEIEKTLYSDEKIHITLTKFGRSHKLFDELRMELQNLIKSENESDKLIAYSYDASAIYWRTETRVRKRFFDTIFIEDEIKNRLINHLDNFYAKEEWYHERGIPYQTGICLYGPAGTGKTSIVKGLASYYSKSLCILRSSEIDYLPKALKKLPNDAFVVIEDIDTSSIVMERNPEESLEETLYKLGRKANESDEKEGVPDVMADEGEDPIDFGGEEKGLSVGQPNTSKTKVPDGKNKSKQSQNANSSQNYYKVLLSDVLNAMDGLVSIDKRVIIFTTNHLEKLDRALIRPGRIDCLEMIDYLSYTQFLRFCHIFYKGMVPDEKIDSLATQYAHLKPKVTVAELQKDFMQGMDIETLMKTHCK
jgi:chaperone BCS1